MGSGTDIGLLTTIFFIFITLGLALPFLNAEFGNQVTEFNAEGIEEQVGQDVTVFKIITSVATMFFWTFGALHPIIDGFFVVIRLVFFSILFKIIRGS